MSRRELTCLLLILPLVTSTHTHTPTHTHTHPPIVGCQLNLTTPLGSHCQVLAAPPEPPAGLELAAEAYWIMAEPYAWAGGDDPKLSDSEPL